MSNGAEAIETTKPASGFLRRRWRREAPLGQLFWRDMVVVGTGINIVTTVASLIAFANGAPLWAGLAIHLLPLPYNLFLTGAVWRTADLVPEPRAGLARAGALIWLLAATLL